jgi:hypothetical protein
LIRGAFHPLRVREACTALDEIKLAVMPTNKTISNTDN